MTSTLRDRILATDDLGREEVEIEEWGETITVRGLTAGEVEKWGREVNAGSMDNIMPKMVAAVCMNGNGQRLFTDDDIEALSGKSPSAILKLFNVAQKLSGIGDDEEATDSGN